MIEPEGHAGHQAAQSARPDHGSHAEASKALLGLLLAALLALAFFTRLGLAQSVPAGLELEFVFETLAFEGSMAGGLGAAEPRLDSLTSWGRSLYFIEAEPAVGRSLRWLEPDMGRASVWTPTELDLDGDPYLVRAERDRLIVGVERRSEDQQASILEVYQRGNGDLALLGSLELGGRVKAAELRGRWLYLLEGGDDLRVLDVGHPSRIRDFSTLEFERGVTLAPTVELVGRSDGVAYVLLDDRLEVVDARIPNGLRSLGRLETLDRPRGLWLSPTERHLAVLDFVWREPGITDAQIVVFDLADALVPARVAALTIPDIYAPETGLLDDFGPVLTAQDGHILLAAARSMVAIDISVPASPRLVASRMLAERAMGLEAGERTAFVVTGGERPGIESYRIVPGPRPELDLSSAIWLPHGLQRRR